MEELQNEMNEETQEQQPQMPTVKELWEQSNFPGKELFQLNDKNEIVLKKDDAHERMIAGVEQDNFQDMIVSLQKSFDDAFKQFEDIKQEWASAQDKVSLYSKVNKFNNYINTLNGLGDFNAIHSGMQEIGVGLAAVLKQNYEQKLAIVVKAESIKDNSEIHTEDWNRLLEEWKACPFVEKDKNDGLWERFEAARNQYYLNKQNWQENREKEQMQNLDLKLEVCEEAAKWADSEDWHTASEVFRKLFDKWQAIGHVTSMEKNNELWERFKTAKDKFYDRKSKHFEHLRSEQEANLELKMKLVEEAETIKDSTNWKDTTDAFKVIMNKWKSIGGVPFERSEEIWERLQKARDVFFENKRTSFEKRKEERAYNLELKQQLIAKAESLKNSSQWNVTTRELNNLMEEWKKIGPVPKEFNEKIWTQFLAAKKHFFDRKDADRAKRKDNFYKRLSGRIEQTEQFLKKLVLEQQEAEDSLQDFKQSLEDTTGESARDNQLRENLKGLIVDLEKKMPSRSEKIKEVEDQLASLHDSLEKYQSRETNKRCSSKSSAPKQQQDDVQNLQEEGDSVQEEA